MKQALDVHRALLAAGVPHEVVRLATPVQDADELPAALGITDGGVDAACLAVRCCVVSDGDGPERLVAVLVLSGSAPSPVAVRQVLGAGQARLATPDEVVAGTGWRAGLVSPVDLPPQVLLLADAAVGGTAVVYAPVGESGLALGIRARDLLVVTGARVAALTGPGCERGPTAAVYPGSDASRSWLSRAASAARRRPPAT